MASKRQSSLLEVITLISGLLLSASITAASGNMTVSGTVNADAFTGDGSGLSNISADQIYVNTVLVSPVGTDTENGVLLRNALASISDAANASNPYLLKIEPGIYHLGNTGLNMVQYVDIEGSGINTTKITSTQCSDGEFDTVIGTIHGASFSELRFLTVENAGTGNFCAAVANNNTSPSLLNVKAVAMGKGTKTNYGIYNKSSSSTMNHTLAVGAWGTISYGIYNVGGTPTIVNTEALATGMSHLIGIYINSSAPTLRNITATATEAIGSYVSWGLQIEGMSSKPINIDHSTFEGMTNSIRNATAIKLNIFSSKLVTGTPPDNSHCIGVVFLKDGVLSEVDSECKP